MWQIKKKKEIKNVCTLSKQTLLHKTSINEKEFSQLFVSFMSYLQQLQKQIINNMSSLSAPWLQHVSEFDLRRSEHGQRNKNSWNVNYEIAGFGS